MAIFFQPALNIFCGGIKCGVPTGDRVRTYQPFSLDYPCVAPPRNASVTNFLGSKAWPWDGLTLDPLRRSPIFYPPKP